MNIGNNLRYRGQRTETVCGWASDWACEWQKGYWLGHAAGIGVLKPTVCTTVQHRMVSKDPGLGLWEGGTHGFVSPLLRQLCTWDFLLFQYPRCQARGGTRVQKLLPRTLWAACSSAATLPCPLKLGGKQMIVIICSLMFFDLLLQLKSILVGEGCVKLSAPQTFLTWSWAGSGQVVKESALQLKLETKGLKLLMKQQTSQLKL